MKTLILSTFSLESTYIKDALSELQTFKNDRLTWYKGKFYTKELFLVDDTNNITDVNLLLDFLNVDGGVSQVITIGTGSSLNSNLRKGDVLINDQPFGSCQKLTDLFLVSDREDAEEIPFRIFAGQIFNQFTLDENCDSLACLDLGDSGLLASLRNKSIPCLNIRIIVDNNEEEFNSDIYRNAAQRLLVLLKRAIEQIG